MRNEHQAQLEIIAIPRVARVKTERCTVKGWKINNYTHTHYSWGAACAAVTKEIVTPAGG